jgi:hypothetical protein
MTRLSRVVEKGAFRGFAGTVFALLFCWPFLAFDRPISVFYFLMIAWALAIVAAFVMSRGDETRPERAIEDQDQDV